MESFCPNCGSTKAPIQKAIWNTKDKIIAVLLFLLFFPAGIIYIIVKQSSNKQDVCPDCQRTYFGSGTTSVSEDFTKVKNIVKTVANDPKVRQSMRDLKQSSKEFRDSFYID